MTCSRPDLSDNSIISDKVIINSLARALHESDPGDDVYGFRYITHCISEELKEEFHKEVKNIFVFAPKCGSRGRSIYLDITGDPETGYVLISLQDMQIVISSNSLPKHYFDLRDPDCIDSIKNRITHDIECIKMVE